MRLLPLAALLLVTGTAPAQTAGDPTGFASAAQIEAQVEAMRREMPPGQGFFVRPLVRDGGSVAALEYWTKPGKPAVHPDQAEYVMVVAGEGSMISGGRLVDPVTTHATLIEGSRIEAGTTRALNPGDVILIPAGTPHWLGITGERLVLLGMKIARAAP